MDVKGKLFVITGSAGGLGKAFAERLLSEGAKVCLSDVNLRAGEETLESLKTKYGEDRVAFVTCDVTKQDSVENLWDESERILSSKVFCIVNNAGVMGEKEGWRVCMEINLTGVIHGTTVAFKKLGTDSGGSGGLVVNVASILGLFNDTQPKGFAYNTSKSAVVTLSRCIGNEASFSQTGVRVLCLCPSVAKTPILQGCTDQEIEKMRKDVGGLMTPEFVSDAFIKLLGEGKPGAVMAVWNKVPPYFIPDTGMGLFIFYTTCAMILRYVPGVSVVRPWMMIFCALGILLSWYLGGLVLQTVFSILF